MIIDYEGESEEEQKGEECCVVKVLRWEMAEVEDGFQSAKQENTNPDH
jgi:hypothetical protein